MLIGTFCVMSITSLGFKSAEEKWVLRDVVCTEMRERKRSKTPVRGKTKTVIRK